MSDPRLHRGRVDLRSAGPLTFGPDGILFLADDTGRQHLRSLKNSSL